MTTQSFTSQQGKNNSPQVQQASIQENAGATFEDNRPESIIQSKMIDGIQNSPKTAAQRKEHAQMFGENSSAQMMEEEDLMQGKFDNAAQMMEEEDLMQGKFDNAAQMMEEEDLMQGKFDNTAQMMEEEDLMQGKFDNTAQMMEEEDLMQGKFDNAAQMMEEEDLMQGKFDNAAPTQMKSENGLPTDVNSKLESTMGADFSGVNIHTNSDQATQMNALAYTQGSDVHFAPGQFKPNTSQGQQLIGHEFAHVVQQAEGRVKPTTEVAGMPVNDNKGLEAEADRIGDKVARG